VIVFEFAERFAGVPLINANGLNLKFFCERSNIFYNQLLIDPLGLMFGNEIISNPIIQDLRAYRIAS